MGLSILAVVCIVAGIAGGAMLWFADVWAMGFDIGKGKRLPWWTLYAVGVLLLALGGLGFVLTTWISN